MSLLLLLALLMGCGKPAAHPAASPNETSPAPADTASVNPDQPSGTDAIRTVPVTIQADRLAWAPGLRGPAEPSPGTEGNLAELATNLERTGSPAVPEGVSAVYVGPLEGG